MKKLLATFTLIGAVVASPLTALAAPQTMPDGTVFDAEYYAQNNPDVVAVLGTDAGVLYQHYVMFGKNEGRLPYAQSSAATNTNGTTMALPDGTVFDPVYYAQNNPDVVAVLGTDANLLAQHYIQFGKAEGRKPSAGGITASQSPISTTAQRDSFDYNLARMNRFMKSVFLGDNEETGWVFDYEAGLKENREIVVTNTLNDQLGIIYDRQGMIYADPALVFERRDWSGDPLYQTICSEVVTIAKNRNSDAAVFPTVSPVFYARTYGNFEQLENMLDNLEIDLEKAGYADYIDLNISAYMASGQYGWFDPFSLDKPIQISASIYYDYRTTDMFENYADYDHYGRLITTGFDEAVLRRHPELANVLAWMKQN